MPVNWRGEWEEDTSRPTRGAWIEILKADRDSYKEESRPTRGAWIEIPNSPADPKLPEVAPHTGRVD